MRLFKNILWFVVMSSLLTAAVWHFFGEVKITATVDGHAYRGLPVRIDGKKTCKTPCTFKPLPGYHTVVVEAPDDEEVEQARQTLYLVTGNLGSTLTAEFTTPLVIAPEYDVADEEAFEEPAEEEVVVEEAALPETTEAYIEARKQAPVVEEAQYDVQEEDPLL